jgi:hypothetical protein
MKALRSPSLRRSAPLKRKTPLRRKAPLKRSAQPMRRVSTKRAKELRAYWTIRREFLAAHPVCQACWSARSTEIHHKRGRAGELLLDTRFFLASCLACHKGIHAAPNKARELGLLEVAA